MLKVGSVRLPIDPGAVAGVSCCMVLSLPCRRDCVRLIVCRHSRMYSFFHC